MGNASIDLSLGNIWASWFAYRKGKKLSRELLEFQDQLEENLYRLFTDLQRGIYQHGSYNTFIVSDNKKREISVAGIRDRVVHRLIYDYLNSLYDETFIYDAWSCRLNKGLSAAIDRAESFFHSHPRSFVWRSDIQKFFDSVNHDILLDILSKKVRDPVAFTLIEKIIRSFSKTSGTGMPIGNLTSQIFANIYFHEFDRFVKCTLKPEAYLRYGDDFMLLCADYKKILQHKEKAVTFLKEKLSLSVNPKNDSVRKTKQGLKFLGVVIYPKGRILNRRNRTRIRERLNLHNAGSYWGMIAKHDNEKTMEEFQWKLLDDVTPLY